MLGRDSDSGPFTRDPPIFFFFLTFALKSGLGSLERSRTPLHALYASGGPEATDAEERT